MRGIAFLALALVPLMLAGVEATVPVPVPDPARLIAARALVRSLPIQQSLGHAFYYNTVRNRVIGNVIGSSTQPPSSTDVARIAQARVSRRIDEVLPEILPAAADEIATSFALAFAVNELEAATTFFAAPEGRNFALRAVSQDPQISDTLYRRLVERLAPEANELIADAEEADRLRREINGGDGR